MITQERLKEVFDYCQDTGDFRWKVRRPRCRIGDVAGSVNSRGYRQIRIDGKRYKAHRLAFLYMTGSFPPAQVDHKDHNKLNNRWDNLRLATNQENHRNRPRSPRNTSGVTGVSWNSVASKWHAQIEVSGHNIYLGLFSNIEDAAAARNYAESRFGFHENHGVA